MENNIDIQSVFSQALLECLNRVWDELFADRSKQITIEYFIDQFFHREQILLTLREATIFLLWKSPDDWMYAF